MGGRVRSRRPRPLSAERLFLAADLPEPARAALHEQLRRADVELPGRPVPPRNWHLTLRFLGDTDPDRRAELLEQLRAATLPPPFPLRLGGFGAFPRPARASVLWLGVQSGAEPLAALAAAAERAAVAAGFPAEPRAFSPHLTLARIHPPANLVRLLERLPPAHVAVQVAELVLFRSQLGGGPPRYEAVERVGL